MIDSRSLGILLNKARSDLKSCSKPSMIDPIVSKNCRDIPVVTFGRQNEFQKVERRADINRLAVDAGYASLLLHDTLPAPQLLIRLAAFFYFFQVKHGNCAL